AEVAGDNYWSDFGSQDKWHGNVYAISGNHMERTLTVEGNAVLTTVIPENSLRWDDINGTGGYGGIIGFSDTH
ncbi:MAG: hypothetical protein IIU91_06480, partial [Alistipes sp.]|nr:hypothetical protein [Alistipes sp.]